MSSGSLHIPSEWREAAARSLPTEGPSWSSERRDRARPRSVCSWQGRSAVGGGRVAWIDADPGQPFIGPPAAFSLALYTDPADLLKRKVPLAMSFIGNTSPVGHLLEAVSGLQKLYRRATALNRT